MKPIAKFEEGYVFMEDARDVLSFGGCPVDTWLSAVPLQIHDIPYDVSVKNADIKFKTRSDMTRDFGDWDESIAFDKFAEGCSSCATPDANVVVFYNNWTNSSLLVQSLLKHFDAVDQLVWHKSNPRPQVRKRNFTSAHEVIYWARRGDYTLNFSDHSDMLSVIKHPVCMGKTRLKDAAGHTLHGSQKPVGLIKYLIEKLSLEGETVLDAYAGCLTTAVAAIRSYRRFIVSDEEKLYVDAGIKWIEEEIGFRKEQERRNAVEVAKLEHAAGVEILVDIRGNPIPSEENP